MGLYAVAASQLVFWLIHTVDRSNLDTFLQKRNFKKRERGTINLDSVPRSRSHASGYQKPMPDVKPQLQNSRVRLPKWGRIKN